MPIQVEDRSAPLDVAATLKGKRLLFVGSTGFVGKVALSMLLRRYPDVGKVFVLVRPGAGSSAEDRFFHKVAGSPVFDPIREVWGDGFQAFLREKCVPLAGDVARPLLNFTDGDFERFGRLDAIVNCAGLVTFDPTLESALRINVYGVQNCIAVAQKTGASLIHVSTCFVAGERDGEIWEDEPVAGYFPRREPEGEGGRGLSGADPGRGTLRDEDFSVAAEIADCQRLIEQVRARADDRASISRFRDEGARRLREDGRDADHEPTLKIAVQRERKMWMAKQLTALGMERAKHWGWTNTYTYTKSLGEQVCATTDGLRYCLVRPAIVESAVRYPFAGWNEGLTTSAPLALMSLAGHRNYPAGDKCTLDVIPVDLVAAGLIAATAATVAGTNHAVYHLGSSDENPLLMSRAVELLALYKRRWFKNRGEGSKIWNRIQSRLEPVAVSRERFDRVSAPLWKGLADGATRWIDRNTPRWGAPRLAGLAEHAKEKLAGISSLTGKTIDLVDMFMPFIYERKYTFRCDQTRALFANMAPHDQAALRWDPEQIDWRNYWLEVHLPGLEKWVFPEIEEEFKAKPKSFYTYKDLLEMFDATTKHHRQRTAMRMLPPVGEYGDRAKRGQKAGAGFAEHGLRNEDVEARRYTYGDLQELAQRGAAVLRENGVSPGDRVLLLSENRPEWGITYFAILKAGATVVPLDANSVAEEIRNCITSSRARAAVISQKQIERLSSEGGIESALGDAKRLRFEDLLEQEPASAAGALVHHPRGDDLASLIFTSGTTGRPKGVMLSHKNFSSLIAKLASVFDFDKHDGLLSVLPLHHTFEFTAGLLMPLMRGAQISYLDELNAESLEAAFDDGHVTGLIGVPALWQLLHRRITKQVKERGPIVEKIFDALLAWNRKLRDRMPPAVETWGLNLGRLLFFPIHQRFGGRIRTMISGGSALPVEVMDAFRGMGFRIFEGYGLTEASPVLTVTRPGTRLITGSVGDALPGIDVKIDAPDASGVGEVIASGPNIMAGYWEDEDATKQVIQDGWLHTGDLGKLDDDGRLYIVGRKKDLILGPNGENVYPDELEDRYRESPYVKELSIVGYPDGDGEVVACLAVPDYEGSSDLPREAVRERLREHVKNTSAKLPAHKRVKILHTTDLDLPKTSTRKVKRKLVVEELQRLERIKHKVADARARPQLAAAAAGGQEVGWLHEVLAEVSGRALDKIRDDARLSELGYDSLMFTELGVALEAAGVAVPENADLTGVATVADLVATVNGWGRSAPKSKAPKAKPKQVSGDADEIHVPQAAVTVGNAVLDLAQRMTYERLFTTRVTGQAYLPQTSAFLVAANHASHLDMGLVKHALGDWGPQLVALAAKDYFFEDPVRRAYFENFTNLVPMDRHGSLRESLRLAHEVISQGYILLIFPEGTRSESGRMSDFKPSIGYLALQNHVDVLPMYLEGTHGALPKGSVLPKRREIAAHIGPLISWQKLREATAKLPRGEQNRAAARIVEEAVRKLAPKGNPDRTAPVGGSGKLQLVTDGGESLL